MSRDPGAFAAELRGDASLMRAMAEALDARAAALCAPAERDEADAVTRERAKRAAIADAVEGLNGPSGRS